MAEDQRVARIYLGVLREFLLIGGPILLIGNLGVLVDVWEQASAVALLVIPEFIWEAFLGICCAFWGFRRDSPILSSQAR